MTKIKQSYKFKEIKKKKIGLGAEFGGIIENNPAHYNKTGAWSKNKPLIDRKKCLACGFCADYCPEGAIEIKMINGQKKAVINYNFCKGCGLCTEQCPRKAIKIK